VMLIAQFHRGGEIQTCWPAANTNDLHVLPLQLIHVVRQILLLCQIYEVNTYD
jgi:hypothetical protein